MLTNWMNGAQLSSDILWTSSWLLKDFYALRICLGGF